MPVIPNRVQARISQKLKHYQPILDNAKTRDVGESDTVTIIVDMLADVFGFDKYSEITSEQAIRGTFCDLAIKFDGVIQTIIEVKAIGIELKDPHVKQAVDYAANQGVDWVVLTNGQDWKVFKVTFEKPINQELVLEFNLLAMNPKSDKDLQCLFAVCKEGIVKSALGEIHQQKQALSRFSLAATIMSEPVLNVIRRELRRASPDARIDIEEIQELLSSEVLKREVLEGEKALEAKKKVSKALNKAKKEASKRQASAQASPDAAPVQEEPTETQARESDDDGLQN